MNTKNDKPISVTSSQFDQEVVNSETPVVVDFWAPWCGPCRAVGPVLETLAQEWAGQVKVVKVNVDEEVELAQAFNIRSIPTIVAMRGREVVDVQLGAGGKSTLEKLFQKVAKTKKSEKAA